MIITSVHRWDDTRIFHKQATSLAKKFDVELHAPADFIEKEQNGVMIYGLPKWKKEKDQSANNTQKNAVNYLGDNTIT